MLLSTPRSGLLLSSLLTIAALAGFGYIKGRFTGAKPLRSGLQTMLIGGLAAAAAFIIAKLIA
jgi:vacuolar iron transporter family protein